MHFFFPIALGERVPGDLVGLSVPDVCVLKMPSFSIQFRVNNKNELKMHL